jgi:outer membrane protein assembly factor BamB
MFNTLSCRRLANAPRSGALCIVLATLAFAVVADAAAQSPKDPHVKHGGHKFKDDRKVLSPPILQKPIYECADTVVVQGFVVGATIKVYIGGTPPAVGSGTGITSSGQPFTVASAFTIGQVVTATQTVNGIESKPSNAVTVKSYKDDYPAGMPQPRIAPTPCLDCGRAVGVTDVIPGATYKVFAEDPLGGGSFGPPVEVGSNKDFGYTFVSPAFKKDQRISAQAFICSDKSPVSLPEIVQAQPASISGPVLDPVYEGADRVVVRGPGGAALLNGATLDVFADNTSPPGKRVGGQPTPGGAQEVLISPNAFAGKYWATQSLCSKGPPGPKAVEQPCSKLPAAKIRQPMLGDTTIELIEFVLGSRIQVYAGTEEIADGAGPLLALTRALVDGETVRVVQSLGKCKGDLIYVVTVGCKGRDGNQCSGEWPAFRHSGLRDGNQPIGSVLADPEKVKTLKVKWTFTPPASAQEFRASPIVHKERVYVGNGNGRLYALDAATGALLWQYPKAGDPALTSQFTCNPSSMGLAASAAIATIKRKDVVIFAAPDRSIGAGLGSGRVFALDAVTGSEVWKSPEAAILNGTTAASTSQLHEQFGYSSPLVLGNRVYLGIANHCDNPIQNGRVVVIDKNSGSLVSGFGYRSTNTRGGGIWSSVAGGLDANAIFITTGNAQCWNGGCQSEPSVNNSLSMLRLNGSTGAIGWKLHPVPFALDGDPDWASGPTLISTRCGNVAASTQKDGWAYAARSSSGGGGTPAMRWQFPPTGFPFASGAHGDTRYLVPGGAWRDTFLTMTGGYAVEAGQINPGFTRLHGLDTCAPRAQPVRWVFDVPATSPGNDYQLGPPTVTRGILFVGTVQGHLIVFADPSVWVTAGSVCSNPEITNAQCAANGFVLVPKPMILANIDLGAGAIFTEPVLAGGRVFVSTSGGSVFMLAPDK